MTISVIINGAAGRMGEASARAIKADPSLQLTATLGRDDDLAKTLQNHRGSVVVDFTTPTSVYRNIKIIIEAGAHPVIGTTGLNNEQIVLFQNLCQEKKLGGIIAPNFSVAAVLMMKYASDAIRYLPHAEILEMHHQHKLDAPSGTAQKTQDMMQTSNASSIIPIHSIRLPGLVAHQEVILGGEGETLHIRHDAIDRNCFMPGVLLACKTVVTMTELVYGLEHILDDEA